VQQWPTQQTRPLATHPEEMRADFDLSIGNRNLKGTVRVTLPD